jgi:hypothetical protein
MTATGRSVDRGLFLRHQAVEDVEQRIDDGLSQRIRRFRDLFIALVAGRQRKVAALIGDDRLGSSICRFF